MRTPDVIRLLCAGVIGLLVCSCAGMSQRLGAPLGTLRVVTGSEAYVNGKAAYGGRPIHAGDDVTTGANTSVVVDFRDGGFLHLDQNTDPTLTEWFEYGTCIIGALFEFGRAYGKTGSECDILINDDDIEAVARTEFNLEIVPGRSILTVIQGTMYLRLTEREVPVHTAEQVVVSQRHLISVRRLSQEELRGVTSWRRQFIEVKGWCCSGGRVFQSDQESCGRSGGVFAVDERAARAECKRLPPREGFCCDNGNVSRSTREDCVRRGGTFFSTSAEARESCRQYQQGWCCSEGTVFLSSAEECWRRKGFFSHDERRVRAQCLPVTELPGYCCRDGDVFKAEPRDCVSQGGRYYRTLGDAQEACRQRRQGWCCSDGRVFQSDQEGCDRSGGVFSLDERSARAGCRPQTQRMGFCCDDGNVSQSGEEDCVRQGGSFFSTFDEARRACSPRVREPERPPPGAPGGMRVDPRLLRPAPNIE